MAVVERKWTDTGIIGTYPQCDCGLVRWEFDGSGIREVGVVVGMLLGKGRNTCRHQMAKLCCVVVRCLVVGDATALAERLQSLVQARSVDLVDGGSVVEERGGVARLTAAKLVLGLVCEKTNARAANVSV